jgi:hypothetical protein
MYREGFVNLARRMAEVAEPDPVDRIRELAFAYRRAALDRPHLYQVMFACPVPEFVPTDEDSALGISTLTTLETAVAAASAAGAIAGDVQELTVGLWALVHDLASLELAGSLDIATNADAVWGATVAATLAGLSHPRR